MPKPRKRLFITRLDSVGFVDKGDDPKAEIVFSKRHTDKRIRETAAGKFEVMTADGSRVLGTHDTRLAAENQLAAIETNKKEPNMLKRLLKAVGLSSGMAESDIDKLLADEGARGGSDDDSGADTGGDMPEFDIKKLDDEAKAEFEKLQGDLATALAKIEELDKAGEGGDDDDLDIPDAVQKLMDATQKRADEAEARVTKLEDDKESERFIAKAAAYNQLGTSPDDFAPVLRKIAGALEAEEFKKFEEMLNAANAKIREGALYKAAGAGGQSTDTSVSAEIREKVEELQKADPNLSDQVARGQVFKAHPLLRQQHSAEVDAARNPEG